MAYESSTPVFGRLARPRDHIVDRLIAERAPRLAAGPAWPAIRPLLYAILDYGKARRMADAIAPLGGRAAIDAVSDLLSVKVQATGLERLPASGRVIVVCNHPTGIADGVAVHDALKVLRPDLMFYANADAHRVCAGFDEVLIPVEWVEAKRTRERTRLTLASAHAAFEAERALVIFPAGRISVPEHGVLTDPPWAPTAISLARRHGAPILPVHVSGPPSVLFNLLDRVSLELRDITLFHELLNKRGKAFAVTIGPLIPAEAIEDDSAAMTFKLKAYVERTLPEHPDQPFA